MDADASLQSTGDETREASECSGCLLVVAWIVCLTSTVLFITACYTNIGLIIFTSPSIPLLMFTIGGGYGVFISLLGAYILCSSKYDLKYCKTTIFDCMCWPCTPANYDELAGLAPSKTKRYQYEPSIQMTSLTVLVSQMCVCAGIAVATMIDCLVRSSPATASVMLEDRWSTLYSSQDGYAVLLQNQDEYKCCGFKNDNHLPAQPCGVDPSNPSGGVGVDLPGCEKALIAANGEVMKQIGISNVFVCITFSLAVYFGLKARTAVLRKIVQNSSRV